MSTHCYRLHDSYSINLFQSFQWYENMVLFAQLIPYLLMLLIHGLGWKPTTYFLVFVSYDSNNKPGKLLKIALFAFVEVAFHYIHYLPFLFVIMPKLLITFALRSITDSCYTWMNISSSCAQYLQMNMFSKNLIPMIKVCRLQYVCEICFN